jgi:CDP-diacylglycerol--serine O-phosphatidyltransferase
MKTRNTHQVSMIGFAKDLPNICSLVGLLCTMFAIYFAIGGNFIASIIAILWSVLFDWFDGIIARKMKGRTKEQGVFGGQLDSMIDIVSFGVLPAILLLSYGNYNIWFIPGAFVIIAASAIRLSYFNIYGLIDSKTYKGLALDNNILILAFVFLFESFFTHEAFSIIIYTILMLLSALNLSSIPTPKFSGKWIYVLVMYVLVLTSIFGWILWSRV